MSTTASREIEQPLSLCSFSPWRKPHNAYSIGRTTMYSLVSAGVIKSVTIGQLRRIPSECLDGTYRVCGQVVSPNPLRR